MNLFGLLGAAGRGVGRGLRTVGQQIGQRLSGAADDDELLRQSLPPSYDGSPNPASTPRPALNYQALPALRASEAITPTASPYDRLPAAGGVFPHPMESAPNPYTMEKSRDFRPVTQAESARLPALPPRAKPEALTMPVVESLAGPQWPKAAGGQGDGERSPVISPYDLAYADSIARSQDAMEHGGKWKTVLRNAALGGLQGIQMAARNPYNDWRAMLTGAASGAGTAGVLSAASNKLGANLNWELLDRPRFEQEQDRRDSEAERQAKQQKLQAEMAHMKAQTEAATRGKAPTPHYAMVKGPDGNPYYRDVTDPANQGMPAYEKGALSRHSYQWMTGPNGKPVYVDTNAADFNPRLYQPYERPRAESDAAVRRDLEDDMTADEGTIEQISNASLEGRKQTLYQGLPAPTRLILEKGQVVEDGYTRAANPAEVQRAHNEWQDVQAKELTRIKAETKAEREKKVGIRAKARRPANTSTAPRTLEEVMPYLR